MPLPYDASRLQLEDCSFRELLLMVGDAGCGHKTEALEFLLNQDLEKSYHALESAVRDDDDADRRNGAMEVLVKYGEISVPKLNSLLRDPNEEVRNLSAVMLGDIGSREGVGALIEALEDPDSNVSHSAAEALGKIGDPAALLPLVRVLQREFWVQYAAVTALGALRDYRAVPHLLQLLDHDIVGGAVIEALARIGHPRPLPHRNHPPYR